MVKFSASTGKLRQVAGFGISAGNVARLKKGEPIVVALDEMGFHAPIDII